MFKPIIISNVHKMGMLDKTQHHGPLFFVVMGEDKRMSVMLCPCACDLWESSCFLKVWRSIYVKRVRDYLLWKNEERKCLENSKSSTKLCEVQCFLWMNSVVWIMGKYWTWWPYPLFMLKCLLNIWLGVVAIVAMWKWWENVSEWKRKKGKKKRNVVRIG